MKLVRILYICENGTCCILLLLCTEEVEDKRIALGERARFGHRTGLSLFLREVSQQWFLDARLALEEGPSLILIAQTPVAAVSGKNGPVGHRAV